MNEQMTIILWSAGGLVVFSILAVYISFLVRDIATRNLNYPKLKDHIWVEFAPESGVGWDAGLLKMEMDGTIKYKGRKYIPRNDRYMLNYPPGRGSMAKIPFPKTIVDPASTDVLLNMSGKPKVDAMLVNTLMEQRDTTEAMDRARQESGGSLGQGKSGMWLLIGICGVAILSIVTLIFTIQTSSAIDPEVMEKIRTALGVQ